MIRPYNPLVIVMNYQYANIGNYTIKVRGFNQVNNDTWSVTTVVLDWPCQMPIVAVNETFVYPNNPYAVDTESGFTIASIISVDCMKCEQVIRQWDVIFGDQNGNNPATCSIHTAPNADNIVSDPEALAIGQYVIRLTVSTHSNYFDLNNMAVTVNAYVNVKSPAKKFHIG